MRPLHIHITFHEMLFYMCPAYVSYPFHHISLAAYAVNAFEAAKPKYGEVDTVDSVKMWTGHTTMSSGSVVDTGGVCMCERVCVEGGDTNACQVGAIKYGMIQSQCQGGVAVTTKGGAGRRAGRLMVSYAWHCS